MDTVAVSIPFKTCVELSQFLQSQSSIMNLKDAVSNAIEYWLENASWKPEIVPSLADVRGFYWKELFLPSGTRLRMKYKKSYYYCQVVEDQLIYEKMQISPSAFANAVSHSSVNAWRKIEILLTGTQQWQLADDMRMATTLPDLDNLQLDPDLLTEDD